MEDKPKPFFSLKQVFRFCRTLRYLEGRQVFYRLYYPVKKLYYKPVQISARQLNAAMQHPDVRLTSAPVSKPDFDPRNNSFTFLNRTKTFGSAIDWNFSDFGLLWSFHLHYFNWIFSPCISAEKALDKISEYIDKEDKGYFYCNSYIASYRLVNWIRFCLGNKVRDERIFASVYRQSRRLAAFPEYELMGNHLLENGIALVWAGLFFSDEYLQRKGETILLQEFPRQILADGVHFEKSYAYHTILLKRLMELAEYHACFSKYSLFYNELIISCSKMLSHVFVLNESGDFPPVFGDGNEAMYISVCDLKSLAQNLSLKTEPLPLAVSGVRRLESGACSLFFNLGNITAPYQPGHAHADAFTFCLNVEGQPLLVDPGVSTYERGAVRAWERSTAAHNTIFLAGADSAEVWASFRMGKRPECDYLIDSDKIIDCKHNGYFFNFEIMHRRTINMQENCIQVTDVLEGWKGQDAGIAFHLYPGIEPTLCGSGWQVKDLLIEIEGAETRIEEYQYAKDFNTTVPARKIVGKIKKETIRTTIVFR